MTMTPTAEQIPNEVAEAAMKAWDRPGTMKDVLAAALSAWPGAQERPYWTFRTHERHSELILPLPKRLQL